MKDCVQTVVSAILGAFLVYLVWLRQRRVDRDELRGKLASALLVELRTMDFVLRRIVADEEAAFGLGEGWLPLLTRMDAGLFSFEPQTVYELLTFRGFCDDIRILRERAQRMDRAAVDRLRHMRVRQKAGYALIMIPSIKSRLEAEGGLVMPKKAIPTLAPFELPSIPESPFHLDED